MAARRPRLGFETDHRTLPAEIGLLGGAVHLDKGCYRGQETVARVHHLGAPPRRLVLLHLDGIATDEPPAPGTPVTAADGRAVGFVGTAVRHHELGLVALAVVKRNVADDAHADGRCLGRGDRPGLIMTKPPAPSDRAGRLRVTAMAAARRLPGRRADLRARPDLPQRPRLPAWCRGMGRRRRDRGLDGDMPLRVRPPGMA